MKAKDLIEMLMPYAEKEDADVIFVDNDEQTEKYNASVMITDYGIELHID